MANMYVQFSEALQLRNEEEVKWAKHHLSVIDEVERSADPDSHPNREEAEYLRQDLYVIDDCECIDFQWDIHTNARGDTTISIYADDSGNIEHAATFVQQYLKEFDHDGHFSIGYATTCDAPRAGEFGGGAVFITALDMQWISSWDWIREREQEHGSHKS